MFYQGHEKLHKKTRTFKTFTVLIPFYITTLRRVSDVHENQ